ncbi:hypothetical protein D3C72_1861000 [compost metagenome]
MRLPGYRDACQGGGKSAHARLGDCSHVLSGFPRNGKGPDIPERLFEKKRHTLPGYRGACLGALVCADGSANILGVKFNFRREKLFNARRGLF